MRFPANIVDRDADGWSVDFPDIPEATTCGRDLEEAKEMAADALATALDFYFEDRRPVPSPSKAKLGQHLVGLSASVSAKVLLFNELLRQELRPIDLARRMNVSKSQMTLILDPRHATKIDTIAAALETLGKRLEMQLL